MSETKCRKCGETCLTMTLESFACDNCGDEYRTVREPGYTQLETELADKGRQLAEITRQRNAYKKALEMAEDELMTVRAEIESLKLSAGELNGAFNARPKCEKCKDKDKLIEQMRKALSDADDLIDEYAADYEHRDNVDEIREEIKAALAAERGE